MPDHETAQRGESETEMPDKSSGSTEVTDRPENAAQLADLIESLTVFDYEDGGDGYQKTAEAMAAAAVAAFNYAARKLGATGFQASWSALRAYGDIMNIEGPFMMVNLHDALYPQYDIPGRVADFITEQRPWLAEQATQRLAEHELGTPLAAPAVVEHWRKLAAVPS